MLLYKIQKPFKLQRDCDGGLFQAAIDFQGGWYVVLECCRITQGMVIISKL